MLGIALIGLILISISIIQYLNHRPTETAEASTSNMTEEALPTQDPTEEQSSLLPPTTNNENDVTPESNEVQNANADSVKQKSLTPDQSQDPRSDISNSDAKASNPREGTKKEGDRQSEKYFLIAGSFDNQENASALVAELTAKGYHPISIGKIGNSYKVAISSYVEKSEADAQKSKLLEKGIETWILKK
jgi:cell division protein FtsN